MKVVEVRLEGTPPRHAHLHPSITVVRGLEREAHDQLIAGFEALAQGRTLGVGGVLDAQGVLLAWTPESLGLLGLPPDPSRFSQPLDVVVGAGDLPGHAPGSAEVDSRLAAAEAARDAKRAALGELQTTADQVGAERSHLLARHEERRRQASTDADTLLAGATAMARARQSHHRARSERERMAAALERSRRRHQSLLANRSEVIEAIEAARARRQAAAEACSQAAAALEAARSGAEEMGEVDLEARRRDVSEAENRLAELTAEAETAARARDDAQEAAAAAAAASQDSAVADLESPEVLPDAGVLDGEIDSLERRRAEVGQKLLAVAESDPTPVQAALVAARSAGPEAPESRRPPQALVAAWQALDEEDAELTRATEEAGAALDQARADQSRFAPEPAPEPEPDPVAVARSRLASARLTFDDAQSSTESGEIDAEDIAQLEAAHTAYLDAQERTEGRFRSSKAQRRLEEARSEERAVLDRLGFSTYADYMMSASNRFGAPGDRVVIEAAQRALVAAEATYAEAWRAANPGTPVPDAFADASPKEVLAQGVWDHADAAEADPAPVVDPPEVVAAEQRRAELAERRSTLEERRQLVRHEATEVLGADPGNDLVGALSASEPPVPADLVDLSQALTQVGVAVNGEALDRAALVNFADTWLTEHDVTAHRRAELQGELARIDDDLVRLWDRRAEQRRVARRTAASPEGDREAAEGAGVAVQERADDAAAAASAGDDEGPAEASDDVATLSRRADERAEEVRRAQQALDRAEAAVRSGGDHAKRDRLARMLVTERQADLDRVTAEEAAAAEALAEAEAAVPDADVAELAEVTAAVTDAEAALSAATAAEEEAGSRISRLSQEQAGDDATRELAEIDQQLTEVDQRHRSALAAVDAAAAELDLAELNVETEREILERQAQTQLSPQGRQAMLDDIEWYLMSRLAAQRAVSEGGSLPLVLDDTFRDLAPQEGTWLLSRLERLAATVQLIYVTDSPDAAAWAASAGDGRAAVAHLEPAPVPAAG